MYIVMFDDEQGLCTPYTHSIECDGALDAGGGDIATFASRNDARQAIRISTKFAELQRAQGVPYCTDFTDCKPYIKIRRLAPPVGKQD